jgi:demethylmenaquinone methyltransferase/2-methoxy-6-polyprenyl-1,4-benzoquinol methylase
MSHLQGEARARYVRQMFGRIARRYDLLNTLITLGQHRRWRRLTARRLKLSPGARALDLGAGTADLTFELLRQHPGAQVIACDFSPEMMALGRARQGERKANWIIADALNLPFAEGTFDGVTSGFLLRNVGDLERALAEKRRVLRPGGQLAFLETTPPRSRVLRPLIQLHFRWLIPLLGRLLAGDAEAYKYLPASSTAFVDCETLAARMEAAGFQEVGFSTHMLGTVAIHWGRRPPPPS